MIEVSLSLIGQEVKNKIAENSFALGHETHNSLDATFESWCLIWDVTNKVTCCPCIRICKYRWFLFFHWSVIFTTDRAKAVLLSSPVTLCLAYVICASYYYVRVYNLWFFVSRCMHVYICVYVCLRGFADGFIICVTYHAWASFFIMCAFWYMFDGLRLEFFFN